METLPYFIIQRMLRGSSARTTRLLLSDQNYDQAIQILIRDFLCLADMVRFLNKIKKTEINDPFGNYKDVIDSLRLIFFFHYTKLLYEIEKKVPIDHPFSGDIKGIMEGIEETNTFENNSSTMVESYMKSKFEELLFHERNTSGKVIKDFCIFFRIESNIDVVQYPFQTHSLTCAVELMKMDK